MKYQLISFPQECKQKATEVSESDGHMKSPDSLMAIKLYEKCLVSGNKLIVVHNKF